MCAGLPHFLLRPGSASRPNVPIVCFIDGGGDGGGDDEPFKSRSRSFRHRNADGCHSVLPLSYFRAAGHAAVILRRE